MLRTAKNLFHGQTFFLDGYPLILVDFFELLRFFSYHGYFFGRESIWVSFQALKLKALDLVKGLESHI
jgi:hypothetical protein